MAMALNCYNFSSQDVWLTDAHPDLISVINDNQVVIVYETIGCLKIYDLTVRSEDNKPVMTVPLIGSHVRQVIHSDFGNYLAVLADNDNEFNSKTVRVYCNYWIEGQAIRVRTNGSFIDNNCLNKSNDYNIRESMSAEVIELKNMSIGSDGQNISCCQSTANLSICCAFKVLLFSYQSIKTSNNVNKTDFILLLEIRVQWFATKLLLVDRYIGLMSKTHFSLLCLNFDYDRNLTNDYNESNACDVESDCFDQNKSIEWDFEDYSKTIRMPSMFDNRSDSHKANDQIMTHCRQVLGPVDQSLCCRFDVQMNHLNIESPICRTSIQVLLCQYFDSEEPLIDIDIIDYNRENKLSSDKSDSKSIQMRDPLLSKRTNDMIGSALLLRTTNNLYNYNIFNKIELKEKFELNNEMKSCLISKSDDTLHLLTEKGLQTYALNFLSIFLNHKKFVPIFKLSFSTFLNIDCLLNTKNYLLLLSEKQNNLQTIYSLRKPSIRELSCDINAVISDTSLKSDEKYNLMTFLNSILYFNCSLNTETDSLVNSDYHKSCINLCNFLIDVKCLECIDSKTFASALIDLAKLEFSHLINYQLNYKLIFDFIANRLELEQSFNVFECDISSLKSFLYALSAEDFIMFCRFCLSQALELDVRLIIIDILLDKVESDYKDSHLPRITLSKLLLDNNDINRTNNYMISLEDSIELYNDFYNNYKIIFINKTFVQFFENSIPKIFYKFLLFLVEMKNSVQLVYSLLENDYEIRIRHNFLNKCYNNNYKHLLDSKLIMCLIEANVELLTNYDNELRYCPIESIQRRCVDWIELLCPHNSSMNPCFCMKCNPIASDLYLLLYDNINENIIKSRINNLLNRTDANNQWLFTARLLSMPAIDAIELLSTDFPYILYPFVSDVCNSNVDVLKKVIHLIGYKVDNIEELDIDSHIGITLCFALNQLALNLNPEELIPLLPNSWKEFAKTYVQKCVTNMQSKLLKQKIIGLGLELKAMFV